MKSLNEILTKEYLAKLDAFVLSMQGKLPQQGYSGARKSTAKGSSLEFSDYREYTMGDDLRRVDWNSYGRSGRLYLKLFLEEKQATVSIFLDSSASMGNGAKFLYAKALAASLAYLSLHNMDRVNVFFWNEALQVQKQNLQSKRRFLEVIQGLEALEGAGTTNFTKSISEYCATHQGQGISIVISDFLTEEPWQDALRMLQYHKQDVIVVWILSEEERNPTIQGGVRLKDQETGLFQDMEVNEHLLALYAKELKRYEAQLREFCKKHNIRFLAVSDTEPLLKSLQSIL